MGFFNGLYKILRGPVRLFWRVKAEGLENVPEGGCLLAANHTSFADPIVISSVSPRKIRFMAKAELFRVPVLGRTIKGFGAFPVNRGGADVKSIKTTVSLVGSGEIVGIFPQGTRRAKIDPRETEVKGGVGMIAYHTKADVVPVFIDTKKKKTSIFRRTRIVFGKVIKYEELGLSGAGRDGYQRAAELIFSRVCELGYPPESEKNGTENS